MTMITPSYLGETIEYSSLHACRSTLEDPTDFWADHVSAFPNEMDWRIMATLGARLNDANLTAASVAQKARFWPGGDSEDSRVQMFDSMFVLPAMGDGYQGFSRIFSYVQADGVSWDSVAMNGANPDQRRSEYVAAYLSLGAAESVLPIMQQPAAGYGSSTAWPVCAGHWDGVNNDPNPSYTCSEANVDAIATAHCSLIANGRPANDVSAFQAGNFGGVRSGPCGATCPTECGCKQSTNTCVAPWLADNVVTPADAGADTGITQRDAGIARDVVAIVDGRPGSDAASTDSGHALDGASVGNDGSATRADAGGEPTGSVHTGGCGCAVVGLDAQPGRFGAWLAMLGAVAIGFVRRRVRRV